MKVALYRHVEWGGNEHVSGEDLEGSDVFVRVSEFVDVEFPPLRDDAVIEKCLSALAEQEKKVRAECETKLRTISVRRAELLQLPFIPATGRDVSEPLQ